MLIKFLHLPLTRKIALLAAIFCFFACSLLILVSHQGNQQLIRHSTELFGESLVQQLSRDASNPLVKGDKLSLQSLLKKLVESPMVVSGTIYDVDNRPLAEAGESSLGLSFSASITFQDSIAGYVVITFNTQAQQRRAELLSWQLTALALLLAGLVYGLSLIPARQLSAALCDLSQIARTPKQHSRANIQLAYRGEDELQQLARDIINPPLQQSLVKPAPGDNKPCAMLLVEIVNLTELQQQPSIPVTELVDALRRQLTGICTLYDGGIKVGRSNSFSAQFYFSDDESDYPFRALCCAYLIHQWMACQQSPLSIRVGLALQAGSQSGAIKTELARQRTIDHILHLTQGIEKGLLASTELYQHSSVVQRVEVSAIDDRSVLITRLSEPYQALLERQLIQLRKQFLQDGA